MTFSEALFHLINGAHLSRGTWVGYIYLKSETGKIMLVFPVTIHRNKEEEWEPKQYDILQTDWRLVA